MTTTLDNLRRLAEEKETQTFHPKGAFSKNHSRYFGSEDDYRLPYKRDVDRIIHSKSYSRYVDKTQVVYLIKNDHITHRGLHVQLVSNFARGVGEILGLNLDLVEAISLGHDVGHTPFGHEGEGYLSELTEEYGLGPFSHPIQSCRLLSVLEPLNLGLHVYDGFLCHDGGLSSPTIVPSFGKSWEDHFEEMEQKRRDPEINLMPGTLEGCLVKISDTMSYLGRDIEDAINLGIISRSEVPDTFLGNSNREILSRLSQDLIEQSYGKDYIAMSERAYDALKVLRQFNFEKIYTHPKLKVESSKIKLSYRILFEWLLQDFRENGDSSYLHRQFLYNKRSEYLEKTSDIQKVVDFISGMTDHYFVQTLENLFIPKRIDFVR